MQRTGALGDGAGRSLRRPGRRRQVEVVEVDRRRCADVDGFSLHADVCVTARDRAQLEQLCRYVARPAIASERCPASPQSRATERSRSTRARDTAILRAAERRLHSLL
ncbi:MAG: transposase [Nannocystaceae bacterium]|nr:transposase [Nannocystaceae bacterium]